MNEPPHVRLHDIGFGYRPDAPVLRGFDLDLHPGLTLIVGPNGCGKSTVLKLLAGVEHPDAGHVEINGLDLWRDEAKARSYLAYVPEQPDVSPYASVVEVLELVAGLRGEPLGRVADVQMQFGLERLGAFSIRELSKGQRRRVLLAASRLGTPPILLLDEPLDALDRGFRLEFLSWIDERLSDGALVVVVTHELEALAHRATRGVSVVNGRAVCRDLPREQSERLDALEPLARGAQL